MSVSPCEEIIPPLQPPWAGLQAVVRFCWATHHPHIEVRFITIVGVRVTPQSVVIRKGGTVRIPPEDVPYGATERWMAGVIVNDVTNNDLKGLTVSVEFRDNTGNGLRVPIALNKVVPPNVLKSFDEMITAPEQSA